MNFRRINITLPGETIALMDRTAPLGKRSRLIHDAIHFYIRGRRQAELKKQLKNGAQERALRDQALAADWALLDDAL